MFGGLGDLGFYRFAVFGLGPQEILYILIIVLVLFGGRKIPEIMRGLGEGMREFKKASSEPQEELKRLTEEEPESKQDKQELLG